MVYACTLLPLQVIPYCLYPFCLASGLNVAAASILSGAGPLFSLTIRKAIKLAAACSICSADRCGSSSSSLGQSRPLLPIIPRIPDSELRDELSVCGGMSMREVRALGSASGLSPDRLQLQAPLSSGSTVPADPEDQAAFMSTAPPTPRYPSPILSQTSDCSTPCAQVSRLWGLLDNSGLGLLVGFLGVVLVAADKMGNGVTGEQSVLGGWALGLFLSSALCKAGASVWAEHRFDPAAHSSLTVAWAQTLAGMLISWVLSLSVDLPYGFAVGPYKFKAGYEFWPCLLSWAPVLSLLYLGVFASAVSYVIQFVLIRNVGAVRQMCVNYVVPVVGMAEGVALRHNWQGKSWLTIFVQITGLVLVLLGMTLIRFVPRERRGVASAATEDLGSLPTSVVTVVA